MVYFVCVRELFRSSDTYSRHALLPAIKCNSARTEKLKSLYQNALRASKNVTEVLFLHLFIHLSLIL